MAKLEAYQRKRDFGRTPEPAGLDGHPDGGAAERFVVHKHAARRLHYDLRLEHDGVLESWAVPKGPSLEPGGRRLAVRVEDHPLEYGDFEGVIPEGNYGAGTVMLWDRGRYRTERREAERLDFVLEGERLRGRWTLVRTGTRKAEKAENWLLIKRSDRPGPGAAAPPPETPAVTSVLSGRTMEQIAAARDRIWSPSVPESPDAAGLPGASPAPLPADPRPQLARSADAVPDGEGWLHEIKFDGYRILARIEDGGVRLLSRNGRDWTQRFPEISAELSGLPVTAALLDGEILALGQDGVSRFADLQEALSAGRTAGLRYQAFDLLHLDGVGLTAVALSHRKQLLKGLLEAAGSTPRARLRFTDQIPGHGPAFFERACRLGLEGIVSKRADKGYASGRSDHWRKRKCTHREELLIGGFTEARGTRVGFGALLLGGYRDGRLVYAGRVGTGFSDRQLQSLYERLGALEAPSAPFEHPPPSEPGLRWVRPRLVAEVEFAEWTREGLLRHAAFRGLREDKDAEEVLLPPAAWRGQERVGAEERTRGPTAAPGAGRPARVAGVAITNPERVLFPEQGATKLALALYYEEIADWILPLLAHRPLALLRCPQGRAQQCFFQKHPGQAIPRRVPRVELPGRGGSETFLYVDGPADLVALAQSGTLELHPWGSRVEDPERPDLIVFDLDPDEGLRWAEVLRTATGLRERLADLGLASFVRTTGGKGLHLVVPLRPEYGWGPVKAFARGIAEQHARDDPGRLTTNMSKARRAGRVFIDYLRNGRGATAIASYSTRARRGAPVAVPLAWDELSTATRSDRYSIENLARRLGVLTAGPWEGFEEARRPLSARMLEAVGVGG